MSTPIDWNAVETAMDSIMGRIALATPRPGGNPSTRRVPSTHVPSSNVAATPPSAASPVSATSDTIDASAISSFLEDTGVVERHARFKPLKKHQDKVKQASAPDDKTDPDTFGKFDWD